MPRTASKPSAGNGFESFEDTDKARETLAGSERPDGTATAPYESACRVLFAVQAAEMVALRIRHMEQALMTARQFNAQADFVNWAGRLRVLRDRAHAK